MHMVDTGPDSSSTGTPYDSETLEFAMYQLRLQPAATTQRPWSRFPTPRTETILLVGFCSSIEYDRGNGMRMPHVQTNSCRHVTCSEMSGCCPIFTLSYRSDWPVFPVSMLPSLWPYERLVLGTRWRTLHPSHPTYTVSSHSASASSTSSPS